MRSRRIPASLPRRPHGPPTAVIWSDVEVGAKGFEVAPAKRGSVRDRYLFLCRTRGGSPRVAHCLLARLATVDTPDNTGIPARGSQASAVIVIVNSSRSS